MTTKTATPIPWSKEYENDTGPNDDYFCEFWRVASGEFHDEADADLCLEAVNNYSRVIAQRDELVMSLEQIANMDTENYWREVIEIARAALAAGKEK